MSMEIVVALGLSGYAWSRLEKLLGVLQNLDPSIPIEQMTQDTKGRWSYKFTVSGKGYIEVRQFLHNAGRFKIIHAKDIEQNQTIVIPQ